MNTTKRDVDQLYTDARAHRVNPKRNRFLLYYAITWNEELKIYYRTDIMHNTHNERQESVDMRYE